jgi:hypothetical protein
VFAFLQTTPNLLVLIAREFREYFDKVMRVMSPFFENKYEQDFILIVNADKTEHMLAHGAT